MVKIDNEIARRILMTKNGQAKMIIELEGAVMRSHAR